MMRFWIVPAMVVALVGLSTPSAAQWTQIGPDGGRVTDIVNDPVTVTTSYAATPAGLYRTTDGGDHWTLLGAGLFLNSPAISATNPSVLYAAECLLRPRPRQRLQEQRRRRVLGEGAGNDSRPGERGVAGDRSDESVHRVRGHVP
jgi:hypothetical protein